MDSKTHVRRRPSRQALVALSILVGTLSVTASTAGAAPAPSSTVTVVCYRGVDLNPGEGPGVGISLLAATGQTVGGAFIECPAGGDGSRIVRRIATSQAAATAAFSCWNGFIQVGSGSGPLALRGECVDNPTLTGLAFLKLTVR